MIALDADGDCPLSYLVEIAFAYGGKGYALPDDAEVELCYEAEAIQGVLIEDTQKVVIPVPTAI